MAMYDQCKTELPELSDRQPVVIGLDAALTGDTFAMVAVSRHPDSEELVVIRQVRIWVPNGQALDFGLIEAEMREYIGRYNVVQVAYDPYQLHYFAQRLNDVVWTEPFNQGSARLESDVTLRTLIVQRRLQHDGSHTVLREHLANADAKVDETGHKLRIVKRAANLKIDAAVALAMASHRALELNLW
jgi:phage terminase large subunit-like protein